MTSLVNVVAASRDPNAIGIATINAAVLAVFLGGLVAYIVVVVQHVHEMTEEILAMARGANEFGAAGPRRLDDDCQDLLDGYDADDPEKREDLLWELANATDALPPGPGMTDDERKAANTAAQRCAMVMYMLTVSPPFPSRMALNEDGVIEFFESREIPMNTVSDATAWAVTAMNLANGVDVVLRGKKNRLGELMATEGPDAAPPLTPQQARLSYISDQRDSWGPFEPPGVYDQFLKVIDDAGTLARATIRKALTLQNYQRARQSPRDLFRAVFAGAVAFIILVTGVLVPMVDESAPRWIFVSVPVAIYLASAVFGLAALAGRYAAVRWPRTT